MFITERRISNSIKFLESIAASFPSCVTSLSDELITFKASDPNSVLVDWYSFVAPIPEALLDVAVVAGVFNWGRCFCC